MASVGPFAWYLRDDSPSGASGTGTVGWSAVTPWSAGLGTPAAGTIIRQPNSTAAVGAERCYVCIISGAVGAGPTFTTTKGVKITDGSATWQECTGQPGLNGDHGAACTATTSGAVAAGGLVLTFSSVPANVAVGQLVIDRTTITGVIPAGATVASFTATTVTLSAATAGAGVGSGDTIAFTNCPTWLMQRSTAVTAGMVIQSGDGTILLICTTAGTCTTTEPSWNSTPGTINSDGATVKWTTIGLTSNAAYGPWKAPFACVAGAVTANWAAAGHSLFIADDHAESRASSYTLTFPGTLASPSLVYCITHGSSMPPTPANLGTAGSVSVTGAFSVALAGSAIINGLQFFCSSGATGANFTIGATGGTIMRFDNCVLSNPATAAVQIILGATSAKIVLNACTVSLGNVGSTIIPRCHIYWNNVTVAGTAVTSLWGDSTTTGFIVMKGCDLSLITGNIVFTSGLSGFADYFLIDCRLNSAATVSVAPPYAGSTSTDIVRCDSGATNYTFGRWRYEGTQTQDIVVVRTGGASNGTTPISSKTVTTANATWLNPFECQPVAIWNTEITQNAVATMRGIWNAAALPLSDQIWVEVEYLGNSNYPICSIATETKSANFSSGIALSADTSAWDSMVTARSDGETVAVNAVRKVADNAGRIFICTAITTGVLATPEPAGMASAVDGGVVTDGGATWRAGVRFVLTVTLSAPQPQLVGYLRAIVKVAVPTSTVWIDPLITMS